MCHIKKFLYVHCPWRKGCENFDGKNREGAKTRCTFFILLSVPSKFKHKRVKHILNYQMFETLTMIGNDECRFYIMFSLRDNFLLIILHCRKQLAYKLTSYNIPNGDS